MSPLASDVKAGLSRRPLGSPRARSKDPSALAADVLKGLSKTPKSLPCKWFYDARGSELFERITELPEYYLTRTEISILRKHAGAIGSAVETNPSVVELGSGSAKKTCLLLDALFRRNPSVLYYPVDISEDSLAECQMRVGAACPQVPIFPAARDIGKDFRFLRDIPGRKLVLYLGSSIGNFDLEGAARLLSQVRRELEPGDRMLLGADLVKDPAVLVPAYDDAQGITAEFNLNLLRRINRELGADFDLRAFRHLPRWNPERSRMESYLHSERKQTVRIDSLSRSIGFNKGETIHTENSYKYTMPMLGSLFESAGFRFERSWIDPKDWFALVLGSV